MTKKYIRKTFWKQKQKKKKIATQYKKGIESEISL